MNYKYAFLLPLFLAFFAIDALAQDELFKILATKGSNKVNPANKAAENLIVGKKLYKTDKITVATGGYIGLAHSCGKTIELKKPGTYEVSKLSAEVAAQNKGVCKKYVDFVVGEMTAQEEDQAKNKYKYMAVTGSVERGAPINTYIPQKAVALNGPITLSWLPEQGIQQYIVKVTNLFDESVLADTVSATSYSFDLSKYNFLTEKALQWEVKGLNVANTTGPKMLSALHETKDQSLKNELQEIKAELGSESALNKFILASVYAEKGLLVDAISLYEAAIALAPEVDEYKTSYNKFLVDKGLAKSVEPKK